MASKGFSINIQTILLRCALSVTEATHYLLEMSDCIMILDTNVAAKINSLLQDEESRRVFTKRIALSIINSHENTRELARLYNPEIFDRVRVFTERGYKVCVYGVGNDPWHPGRVMCEIFRDQLAGVFDRNAHVIDKIELIYYGVGEIDLGNVPVLPPEEISRVLPNIVVIVTTPNPTFQKEIFEKLTRLDVQGANIIFLPSSYSPGSHDYFAHQFLKYDANEALVDCGCLDGKTSKLFIDAVHACGNKQASIAKIFAYEPDNGSFNVCCGNLSCVPFAQVKNAAVWSKTQPVSFNTELEKTARRVDEGGSVTVDAVTLDDDLEGERVSFIKMDIEGAELNALKGAEKIIRLNRPTLAISVYHTPDAILTIPEFIMNLELNYRFYLRHQSMLRYDTVLYAV